MVPPFFNLKDPDAAIDSCMTQDEIEERIEHAETLKVRLLERRFVVYDASPRCMGRLENGVQCDGQGRYQPYAFIYAANTDQLAPKDAKITIENSQGASWTLDNQPQIFAKHIFGDPGEG